MSPVVQPPWPLQAFMTLQACLLVAVSEALVPALSLEAHPVIMVPANKPVMAAVTMSAFAVLVIGIFDLMFYLPGPGIERPASTDDDRFIPVRAGIGRGLSLGWRKKSSAS